MSKTKSSGKRKHCNKNLHNIAGFGKYTALFSSLLIAGLAYGGENTLTVTAEMPADGLVATSSDVGTKTQVPLVKTPQSISVVTRSQMDAQGALSVSDALNYTSGVMTNYRGSSNRNDELIIRGFSYATKFLDGLSYGVAVKQNTLGSIDPWFLERVELVHGPASVLYGQINPGGIVNMTSKRPVAESVHQIRLRGGNQHLGEFAFDFGGSLNNDNTLMYRLNGIASTQNQFIQDFKLQRIAVAPALTWLLSSDTQFTLLARYQNDPKDGYRNFLPYIGTVVAYPNGFRIPYDMNVSDPNFNLSKREQTFIGYQLEHNFNDKISFTQNLRYDTINSHYKFLVYGDPISGTNNYRLPQHEENKIKEFGVDNRLNVKFKTGDLSHNIVTGLEYKWSNFDDRIWRIGRDDKYNLDFASPFYGISIDESKMGNIRDDNKKLSQTGLYIQDQLEWQNWNLLLSGRYDWSKINILQNPTTRSALSKTTKQNDGKFTWRAGLLYAFYFGFSPYISYSTSFEPNLDHGSPGTAPFKPTMGEQYEAGLKYQPRNSNTMLTLSLFDLTQKNVTSGNPITRENEQIGKINSRGVEAEVHSQITPEINLIASYTLTDSRVTEDHNTAVVGKPRSGLARNRASLWGSYSFQQGLLKSFTLGAGVRYTGNSTTYDYRSRTFFDVPGYTLYDLMVRYNPGEIYSGLNGVSVQFNVNNLANKHYVASCGSYGACFYGSGRSMFVTVNYNW